MIKTIDPKSISIPELHGILLGSISPRPIAFVSTVDKDGNVNLSPFSFFNVFSANPPILIFSPARRVKGNTTKHTLDNVHEVKQACISIVTYDMVQQVSLSSTEYDQGVNEFIKSGLTEEASEKIKPPRVKESPVSFECVVKEIQPLGTDGGAGNLVICEVVLIHLDEAILDENNKIDPIKKQSAHSEHKQIPVSQVTKKEHIVLTDKTGTPYDKMSDSQLAQIKRYDCRLRKEELPHDYKK